MTIQNEVFKAS